MTTVWYAGLGPDHFGFATRVMWSSRTHSATWYGPLPTGLISNAFGSARIAAGEPIPNDCSAMSRRNGPSGRTSLMTTRVGLGACTSAIAPGKPPKSSA